MPDSGLGSDLGNWVLAKGQQEIEILSYTLISFTFVFALSSRPQVLHKDRRAALSACSSDF